MFYFIRWSTFVSNMDTESCLFLFKNVEVKNGETRRRKCVSVVTRATDCTGPAPTFPPSSAHAGVVFRRRVGSSLTPYVNWLNVKANAERRYGETHKPGRNALRSISSDKDRSEPVEGPSMDLTRPRLARPVRLLWNCGIWWYGRGDGLEGLNQRALP